MIVCYSSCNPSSILKLLRILPVKVSKSWSNAVLLFCNLPLKFVIPHCTTSFPCIPHSAKTYYVEPSRKKLQQQMTEMWLTLFNNFASRFLWFMHQTLGVWRWFPKSQAAPLNTYGETYQAPKITSPYLFSFNSFNASSENLVHQTNILFLSWSFLFSYCYPA